MIKRMYLNNCLRFIEKYCKDLDKGKINIIKYGLESLYLSFTKLIPILIFATLIGIIKESIAFIVIYNIVRLFGFGLHATKSYLCFIGSLSTFILIPIISMTIVVNIHTRFIICLITTIIFMKYSPADTEKRPIINIKKRKFLNIATTTVAIIYTFVCIYTNNMFLANIIMFSLVTEAFMIHPSVYKLFKMPYNNYIEYLNKNHGLK